MKILLALSLTLCLLATFSRQVESRPEAVATATTGSTEAIEKSTRTVSQDEGDAVTDTERKKTGGDAAEYKAGLKDLKQQRKSCRRDCEEVQQECRQDASTKAERDECKKGARQCRKACNKEFEAERSSLEEEIYGD